MQRNVTVSQKYPATKSIVCGGWWRCLRVGALEGWVGEILVYSPESNGDAIKQKSNHQHENHQHLLIKMEREKTSSFSWVDGWRRRPWWDLLSILSEGEDIHHHHYHHHNHHHHYHHHHHNYHYHHRNVHPHLTETKALMGSVIYNIYLGEDIQTHFPKTFIWISCWPRLADW